MVQDEPYDFRHIAVGDGYMVVLGQHSVYVWKDGGRPRQ